MKTSEDCPLCGHAMIEHTYRDEADRLWLLFFCDVCEADFAAVGMDEFITITGDPLGTRPVNVVEAGDDA